MMDDRRRATYHRETENIISDESRTNPMAGIMVFSSISEALRAGFEVCDRTSRGCLVRTRTSRGWALAIVLAANSAS
jgi:hypothetical protein